MNTIQPQWENIKAFFDEKMRPKTPKWEKNAKTPKNRNISCGEMALKKNLKRISKILEQETNSGYFRRLLNQLDRPQHQY